MTRPMPAQTQQREKSKKLKPVYRKRLLKLAAFLDKLPRRKFDIVDIVKKSDGHGCGTVCCAWGWAPRVFPSLLRWSPCTYTGALTVKYRDSKKGYANEVDFFGLEDSEAGNTAFFAYGYRSGNKTTPKQVAARLREIASGGVA